MKLEKAKRSATLVSYAFSAGQLEVLILKSESIPLLFIDAARLRVISCLFRTTSPVVFVKNGGPPQHPLNALRLRRAGEVTTGWTFYR